MVVTTIRTIQFYLFNLSLTFSFCYNVLVHLICIYLIISLQWLVCTRRVNKNKPVNNMIEKQKPKLDMDTHGLNMVLPHCGSIVSVFFMTNVGEINRFDLI